MPIKICPSCRQEFKAHENKTKFCSYACTGVWRSRVQRGEKHPSWRGGKDKRACVGCGAPFEATPANPKKFCSRDCSRQHQKRLLGPDNPMWKPESRRKNRRGKHGSWARAVISRDLATCQKCGAKDAPLHAHHIKPFADYPELRWEIDNGLTVCAQCHWAIHAALDANGVKSGEVLPGGAGDNPEPSFGRKPVEGVTTNGRAYRRWSGSCDWCGKFISKSWSDAKGKKNLFCSYHCSGKHRAAHRTWRPIKANGSNSDTSALPERDDIV